MQPGKSCLDTDGIRNAGHTAARQVTQLPGLALSCQSLLQLPSQPWTVCRYQLLSFPGKTPDCCHPSSPATCPLPYNFSFHIRLGLVILSPCHCPHHFKIMLSICRLEGDPVLTSAVSAQCNLLSGECGIEQDRAQPLPMQTGLCLCAPCP